MTYTVSSGTLNSTILYYHSEFFLQQGTLLPLKRKVSYVRRLHLLYADETSDGVITNVRSETTNLSSAVACGNGGISNNTATSSVSTCDAEVCMVTER